jgi:hypothetical protein
MLHDAESVPSGSMTMQVIRGPKPNPTMRELIAAGVPHLGLPGVVNAWRARNLRNLIPGLRDVAAAKLGEAPTAIGTAYGTVFRENGDIEELGLLSARVITTAGVNAIGAGFVSSTLPAFKYHGFGSGSTAAAIGDTALVTEYTTQYATDNVRPTGTQTNPSANVYQSIGIFAPDATVTPTECGIFSQAATGGGTLLDRFVFTGVPLTGSADSLQITFQYTTVAGG